MGACGCSMPKMGGCAGCNPSNHNFIGYSHPVYTPNQQGWICPRCAKSNAPWMPFCCTSEQAIEGNNVRST